MRSWGQVRTCQHCPTRLWFHTNTRGRHCGTLLASDLPGTFLATDGCTLSVLGLLPQAVEPNGGGWGPACPRGQPPQVLAPSVGSQQLWRHQPAQIWEGSAWHQGGTPTCWWPRAGLPPSPHRGLTWPSCAVNAGLQPLGGLMGGGHQSEHISAGLVCIHKGPRVVLRDKRCQRMTETWPPGAALLRGGSLNGELI